MTGCSTCEAHGHRSHDSHLPEVLLCPVAIDLKRRRTVFAMRRYRATAKGLLNDVRREANRRGHR